MVKKSGQEAAVQTSGGWKFSIADSFSYGMKKTGEFFWPTIGLAVLCEAVVWLLCVLQVLTGIFGLIICLFSIVVNVLISIGWIKILLAVLNGQKPALKYFSWADLKYFWTMLGTNILYSLIILGGYILLVIPGLVWTITYAFAPLLVIDKKLSVTQALAASRKLVSGQRWPVFLWSLAIGIFNLAGLLCLGLGLLFTLPVSFYASAYLYGRLAGKTIN
ncbi:MAG: hypothetical protein LBQ83_07280 [Candidatus Margulisbacteria bacterium]|jgi:uncharacterized membrane protein|nr:hypothetical protein [Candidatus Margulisiibacteriota bacterium]